jgi:hypothetical protein
MDELPEGVVGVAETPSHLLLGAAVNEDGSQRLVLALSDARGLQEEVSKRIFSQGVIPGCEVISRRR